MRHVAGRHGVVTVLIVLLSGAATLSAETGVARRETPAQTVRTFYSGTPRAQCLRSTIELQKSLRTRLTGAARLTPLEACIRYNRRQPRIRPSEVLVGSVKVNGPKATVEVTTPPPNGPEVAHLVRRNGVWKVDFIGAGQE